MRPRYLTYLHQNWVVLPGPNIKGMCLFLIYSIINYRFSGPVARQPALPWQPLWAPLVGGRPHVSPRVWSWSDHAVLS